MTQTPTALTPDLLARVRPGAAVAVAVGAALGTQRRRPTGYQLHARAQLAASTSGRRAPEIGKVAVVQIRGAMAQYENEWDCVQGYDGIARDICAAATDPGVAALVVDADTPWGDEPGLVEGSARIRRVLDQVSKPVLGYTPAFLASAGVYLLLAICDTVHAHPTARVGSVSSVILYHSDARKLAKEGTDVYVARGVPGKMNPNPLEPLDALGKARLDKHALACSEDFIAFVAAKRGLDPDAVRAWNADMFRGQEAVDVGLVDSADGDLDTVIALAGSLAGLQEAA